MSNNSRNPKTLLVVCMFLLLFLTCYLLLPGFQQPVLSASLAGPRFLDVKGNPLAGITVRILCYTYPPASKLISDQNYITDKYGYLIQQLPLGCYFITALQPLYTQPSGKPRHGPAFVVYATSWPLGTPQYSLASANVTLNPANHLVLFRINASVDRELPQGSSYLTEIKQGLQQASAYLFDLTDGQAAIGSVQLNQEGREWNNADLRFLTANDYRPAAFVGGIVPGPLSYKTSAGKDVTYNPAAIYLGRYWNGAEAFDPPSCSTPNPGCWAHLYGYSTLGHEWSHYAFFLYDEYQILIDESDPFDGAVDKRIESYCLSNDLPINASAMAWNYTATEFWHPNDGNPENCIAHPIPLPLPGSVSLGTDQWYVHGETDWGTLGLWGMIQHLQTGFSILPPQPGPAQLGLVTDLFDKQPGSKVFLPNISIPGAPQEPVQDVTVYLHIPNFQYDLQTLYTLKPEVYLIQKANNAIPAGLIFQGTTQDPTSGKRTLTNGIADLGFIRILGTGAGDQLRIYVDYEGGRYVYPAPGVPVEPLVNGRILNLVPMTWTPSLKISYFVNGDQVGLNLLLTSPQQLASPPIAQMCVPDASIHCSGDPVYRKIMQRVVGSNDTWSITFSFPNRDSFPPYGLLMISAAGRGDFMRWFQDEGGVGPAHMFGDAPLRDGMVTVDAVSDITGQPSKVIIMPAGNYQALLALQKLPNGISGIIGQPVDLDILYPNSPLLSPASAEILSTPVILTLFYSQAAYDRVLPPNMEANLRVLWFNPMLNGWEVVSNIDMVSKIDPKANWVSSFPRTQDGIYVIGW